MAFADRIRIVENDETRRVEAGFAARFKALSGFDYPPKDQAEWTIVLTRAGFSQARVEQFLNEIGFTGFDDCGELPRGYVSAPHGEWPIFSVLMIEGLERWAADQPTAVASQTELVKDLRPLPHQKSAAILAELSRQKGPVFQVDLASDPTIDISERTIRDRLHELKEMGLVERGKSNGWIITELGRAYVR